ncbi:MAG: NADH-quinone oxidoreductase subunit NuoF [Spongiibacteraceae bacterium]|nr:NADH-quinone oxidoreductase subunit NuoF [Spongiibacteraceae bacterium]
MTDLSLTKPLTHNIIAKNFTNTGISTDLDAYQASGGYQGVNTMLATMSSNDVIDQVTQSGLKGRGGAGFLTGLKWSFVPRGEGSPTPKYLVANADEMEPGTFKDRLLMEADPHQLIEGMIIAAYAMEAQVAYIFLRGEYTRAEKLLHHAINECYQNNLLGKNILSSDFSLDLYLHTSAGRYICGEETALLSALEGKRANPRAKPPFPQVSGAWGKPSVVNNVETLCNLPHILKNGNEWYHQLSLVNGVQSKDMGTKLFGVSGRVNNPGCWELPMGTRIGEIIEEHAGGMSDGYQLKGFLPGGASTDFLTSDHLNLAMEYESIAKAGSRMGTGTMIVLDDKTCPVGMVLNIERFFAQESCGWCTPCRDGLPWTEQLLQAIEAGHGVMEDLDTLMDHTRFMAPGNTFCALAPGAMEPLQSALNYFRDDFEQHIYAKRCPYTK